MKLEPYNANDPLNIAADRFRVAIARLGAEAFKWPEYRKLDGPDQLTSFMYGTMTGLIGVAFSHITPEGRDLLMAEIKRYLPHARQNAEAMVDDAETKTRKH